jgi:hypothetical protein
LKKTKRKEFSAEQVGTIIVVVCAVLLAGLIALTVFFAVDSAKYSKVFGTVNENPVEKGHREVTILYVIEGDARLEPIDNAPRSWSDQQLVQIEYREDDVSQIRVPVSVLPYVLGYLVLGAILTAGILIRLGKIFRKEIPE